MYISTTVYILLSLCMPLMRLRWDDNIVLNLMDDGKYMESGYGHFMTDFFFTKLVILSDIACTCIVRSIPVYGIEWIAVKCGCVKRNALFFLQSNICISMDACLHLHFNGIFNICNENRYTGWDISTISQNFVRQWTPYHGYSMRKSFNIFYLSMWNQLVCNQMLQLFV